MEMNFKKWLSEVIAPLSASGIKTTGTTGTVQTNAITPNSSGQKSIEDKDLSKNITDLAGIMQRDLQKTGQSINDMTKKAVNKDLSGIVGMFRAYDAKNKNKLPKDDKVLAAAITGLTGQGETK